ncbi:MAG: hypothetical protein R3C01_15525 [Planctomycetaceae bacterium]
MSPVEAIDAVFPCTCPQSRQQESWPGTFTGWTTDDADAADQQELRRMEGNHGEGGIGFATIFLPLSTSA